jgi:hypothetical protein
MNYEDEINEIKLLLVKVGGVTGKLYSENIALRGLSMAIMQSLEDLIKPELSKEIHQKIVKDFLTNIHKYYEGDQTLYEELTGESAESILKRLFPTDGDKPENNPSQ